MERGDGLAEMYCPRILRLATRKSKQLPRERLTARGGCEDCFQRTDIFLVGHPAHERLCLSAHHHQQIVEVVCDAAGQLTERRHISAEKKARSNGRTNSLRKRRKWRRC